MHFNLNPSSAGLSTLIYFQITVSAAVGNGSLTPRSQLIPVAGDTVQDFAQSYGLDWICLTNANQQKAQFNPGDLCIVPLDCCVEYCLPPFCNQLPGCARAPTSSVPPPISTSTTCTATITGNPTHSAGISSSSVTEIVAIGGSAYTANPISSKTIPTGSETMILQETSDLVYGTKTIRISSATAITTDGMTLSVNPSATVSEAKTSQEASTSASRPNPSSSTSKQSVSRSGSSVVLSHSSQISTLLQESKFPTGLSAASHSIPVSTLPGLSVSPTGSSGGSSQSIPDSSVPESSVSRPPPTESSTAISSAEGGHSTSSAPPPPAISQSHVVIVVGANGAPVTLTLPPGSTITGPITLTTDGRTLTVAPISAEPHPSGPSPASKPDIVTVTGALGTTLTLTLPPGSSITGTTTLTTDGRTLTVAPIQTGLTRSVPPSASNVVTLKEPNGSSVTLTLPLGSLITGSTTLTADGQTITGSPGEASATHSTITHSPSSEATPVIVIGGTSIPFAFGSRTVTEADGSTIVIEPSGVVIGTNIIPIPTKPTTMTTAGQTLTFDSEPPQLTAPSVSGTASSKPSGTGAQSASGPSGSGVPSGTITITPPPPGAPGSIPTNIPPESSPVPEVEISFQSETYMLPWTGTVDLLQSDGSAVTLAPNQIVSGTSTLPISGITTPTSLSLGGLSINAQPGSSSSPSTGGLSGFGGLLKALEGLAGPATSIANTLDEISEQGVLWAAGGLSDASFSTSVDGLLDTAIFDLTNWVSEMNGVFQDYNSEVWELTEDGPRRVFQARTGAVETVDILKSLRKLTANLANLKANVIALIKAYWTQGTTSAAVLAAASQAMRNFGDYPWGNEKQQSTSSSSATKSSSTNSAGRRTKTSTSSTSSSTATPTPYVFQTKPGTDPNTFQSYIKSLDDAKGMVISFPSNPWQSYATDLTADQADAVAKQSFIDFIFQDTEDDNAEMRAVFPRRRALEKRLVPGLNLKEREPDSDVHLRLISAQNQKANPNGPLANYLFDPTLGQGQTIYIIDTGCLLTHSVGNS